MKNKIKDTAIITLYLSAVIFALFAMIANEAHADSLDVGYIYHTNSKLNAGISTVGGTITVSKIFDVKLGLVNEQDFAVYVMGKTSYKTKYIDYGVNFGFMRSREDVQEKTYSYTITYPEDEYHRVIEKTINGERTAIKSSYYEFTVMPTITLKLKRHAIELGYIPKLLNNTDTRISLQYQFKL